MTKVMTQLDLLIKHVIGSTLKACNVIASKGTKVYKDDDTEVLDEEIWFMSKLLSCFPINLSKEDRK